MASHFSTSSSKVSTVMPVSGGDQDFLEITVVSLAIASRRPKNGFERFGVLQFRLFRDQSGTRSRQKMTCVYIGCSTHSVPS